MAPSRPPVWLPLAAGLCGAALLLTAAGGHSATKGGHSAPQVTILTSSAATSMGTVEGNRLPPQGALRFGRPVLSTAGRAPDAPSRLARPFSGPGRLRADGKWGVLTEGLSVRWPQFSVALVAALGSLLLWAGLRNAGRQPSPSMAGHSTLLLSLAGHTEAQSNVHAVAPEYDILSGGSPSATVDVKAVAAKYGWDLTGPRDWSADPRVRRLRVAEIRRPLRTARPNNDEKVVALMQSIAEVGQLEPIDVLDVNSVYWGFSGCHRYEAHVRLGKEDILCRVRKATPEVLKFHVM